MKKAEIPSDPFTGTIAREYITPEQAAEYFENRAPNRNCSIPKAVSYQTEMLRGKWGETTEIIAFDTAGRLLQGQHRMWAVEKSGIGRWFTVSRGVDPNAPFDRVKPRRASDDLERAGVERPLAVAAAARAIWMIENGIFSTGGNHLGSPSNDDVLDIARRYPDLSATVEKVTTFARERGGFKKVWPGLSRAQAIGVVAFKDKAGHDFDCKGETFGDFVGAVKYWQGAA